MSEKILHILSGYLLQYGYNKYLRMVFFLSANLIAKKLTELIYENML